MTIAVLMPMSEQRGGGELMFTELLKHGRQGDIRWVAVFFNEGHIVDEVREMGIETIILSPGRLRQVFKFVSAVRRLAAILRNENVDLVFSWSAKPHLYGSLAAKMTGVQSAWYQLGYPTENHLSTLDRVATALPAQAVVTLSKAGAEAQQKLWPSRDTPLVYPSVQLDRFDPSKLPTPAEARDQIGLPADGPLIGIVGRLQRWKGMHTLVAAAPIILESHPDARFVIVGGKHDMEAEYEAEVRNQIDSLGLVDRITMAGFQRDVPLWTQAMDVVVHASNREPFGIVVIEAMALGKPMVAGDAAGPQEIITEDVNGLLAPYDDHARLAEQIIRYLDDPAFAARVGAAARERALDFSPEHYARELTATLKKLAA